MTATIVLGVFLLAYVLRAVPQWLSPQGLGVDHWFWKTYIETYRRERRFPPELPQYVLDEAQWYPPLFPMLLARLLGLPSVVSLGGNHRLPQEREGRYYFGSRWISYGMEHAVLSLCDAVAVPNRFTGRYVAGIIGDERARRKTTMIPWIVEPPKAAAAPADVASLGLSADLPLVLVVGHLNHYKYTLEMFDVAADVLRTRPGVAQFVFCGDGPLRAEGERRLAGLPAAPLLGWQPHEMVLGLMQRASIVLVPMSGFVLLEAAALGRPVVASNVEWHGEVITEGETGWLVRPDAVPEWVGRIHWILDHPDIAGAAGRRLRELFLADYAPEVAQRQEADLYSRLVAARQP